MNILYVYADNQLEWNCSEWRCAIPARAINRSGKHHAEMLYINDWMEGKEEAALKSRQADIIIVQRNLFGDVLVQMEVWKSQGKTIVVDLDDDYAHMPKNYLAYDFWINGKISDDHYWEYKPIEQLVWGVKLCHALISPSKVICKDWEEYTPTYLVPNYIETSSYPRIPRKGATDELVIGWGGSVSHYQSWMESGLVQALGKIGRKRKIKVLVAGSDDRIPKALPLRRDQIVTVPTVPFKDWHKTLAQYDIGLAPLSGDYDQRRSWIKPLEYMLLGIPWIASKGMAYAELDPYGTLVENSPENWERALLDYIDKPALRNSKVEAAFAFSRAQDVDKNVDAIIGVFEKIIDSRRISISSGEKHMDLTSPQGLMESANDSIRSGDWQGAIQMLLKASSLSPEDEGIINGLGVCYLQTGQEESAIAAFKKVTALVPRSPEGFNNLGVALAAHQQIADAEQAYLKALEIDSENGEAWRNLAKLYIKQANRIQDGLEILGGLLHRNPDDLDDLLFLLGSGFETIGDEVNAEKTYLRVLQLKPNHQEAHAALERLINNRSDFNRIAKPEHAKKLASLKGLLKTEGKDKPTN